MSPVRYAGGILDRAAKLREDDDWISAALVSDAAMAVLIHNDQNLVTRADRPENARAAVLSFAAVRERVMTTNGGSWVFLGLDGEVPMFGVDASTELIATVPEIRVASGGLDGEVLLDPAGLVTRATVTARGLRRI